MTAPSPARTPRAVWLGMLTGPAAWAINTQLAYALVPWACAHGDPTPWLALGFAALAVAGSWHSWRGLQMTGKSEQTTRLLAALGTGLGLFFALIILVQGMAGLFFHGCER